MELHHPLLHEFPEYRSTIYNLKASDEEFRKRYHEYHDIDEAIYRIEESIEFATDAETEELKKKRAFLKDQLYHAIRQAHSAGR
jgi:hypothetical protein